MLLIEVEQHGNMRCTMDVLQLMTRKLRHYDAVLMQIVENVKKGNTDVACQNGTRYQMMYEACGGGLALGTGDTDGEVAIDL